MSAHNIVLGKSRFGFDRHSRLNSTGSVYLYWRNTIPPEYIVVKLADKREANVHSQLSQHAPNNIIRMFRSKQVSQAPGKMLIATAYAHGGTLADLLAHAGAVPGRRLPAHFCTQLMSDLAAVAIELQVVHGLRHIDLHARNVVFDLDSGYPAARVIDFGKMHQLPPEDDEAVDWDNEPNPTLGPLARVLVQRHHHVLEREFLALVYPLACSSGCLPMHVLAELRNPGREARVGGALDYPPPPPGHGLPPWMVNYFQALQAQLAATPPEDVP